MSSGSQQARSRRLLLAAVTMTATLTSLHAPLNSARSADTAAYAAAREAMVANHLETAGIENQRVLAAMRSTLRHEFLATSKRHLAYYDMAVPIGEGQTISPPYIVAFMTEQLDPQPDDRVLEIGTGSGYQAAVLSPLVKDVYTIEIQKPLGLRAAAVLRRLDYKNVHTKIGDGYEGWPEHAPFTKMIVTCSPEKIPQPLIDQLAEDGQIIVPVGERFQQTLCRFRKKNGQMERETLQATFFVPMTGESEEKREIRSDDTHPQLINGSFEESLADQPTTPAGWYYLRECQMEAVDDAPDAKHILSIDNDVAGRSAHALQAFGVDGRVIRQLRIGVSVRGERLANGDEKEQQPRLMVEFYGAQRNPVGQATIGPWKGSFAWDREVETIPVPPAARLAVVAVGLFGGTGRLAVDHIQLEAIDVRK